MICMKTGKALSVAVFAALLMVIVSCTTTIAPKDAGSKNATAAKQDYTSMFENAEKNLSIPEPSVRDAEEPLILVHYMPWFEAPGAGEGYGFHWHQGGAKFDPYTIQEDGTAKIASHYYPLTGPYDTRDVHVLEYQAALMKIAGIDGVIFDWYGNEAALDYPLVHESTLAMIDVLKRAGLKYAICYEDQSIGKMIEAGNFAKADALEHGKAVFSFMEENWFHDEAYVKKDGRPVVLCFGPQYFKDKAQWEELFACCEERPYFVSLEGHSENFSDGAYNWFNMNGRKTIPQVVSQLNNYYQHQKNKDYLVCTAFGGFHDIYAEAGGKSYGYLDSAEGKTFNLTLNAAVSSNPDIIQIATWNDYGEGTVFEPTIQNGYRDLQVLQDLQKKYDAEFPFSYQDLRAPLALYKLIVAEDAVPEKKAAARIALDALLAGDVEAFRAALSEGKIVVDFAVRPILQTPTTSSDDETDVLYATAGRKNLALGKPVVANNKIYDFTGSKAVDGDINTYWEGAANKYPNIITVDLVSNMDLDAVLLKLNPQKIWGKRVQKIEVRISDDDKTYTTLIPLTEYVFNPVENANTVIIPLNAKARYVQIEITGNTQATAGQIAELEVYAAN